jgi:hypothetical protein
LFGGKIAKWHIAYQAVSRRSGGRRGFNKPTIFIPNARAGPGQRTGMLCNNTVTIAEQNHLAASGTASEAVAPHKQFCLRILRLSAQFADYESRSWINRRRIRCQPLTL